MPPVSTGTFREDGGAGAIETYASEVVKEAANNAEDDDWVAQLSNRMFGKKPPPIKGLETSHVLGVVPEEEEAPAAGDEAKPPTATPPAAQTDLGLAFNPSALQSL